MVSKKLPFITFEGGEGVGKSTQIKLLRDRLPKLYPDKTFVFTREPGGTLLAERIRSFIIADEQKEASSDAQFFLFTAARVDHVRALIAPALDRGEVVICDRFDASSYAYQVCAEDLKNARVFESIFSIVRSYLYPHLPGLTLFLDPGDPRVGLKRVASRGESVTHFEERSLRFHERLLEGYRHYAQQVAPDVCQTIMVKDKTIEEVHQEVLQHIRSVLQ